MMPISKNVTSFSSNGTKTLKCVLCQALGLLWVECLLCLRACSSATTARDGARGAAAEGHQRNCAANCAADSAARACLAGAGAGAAPLVRARQESPMVPSA